MTMLLVIHLILCAYLAGSVIARCLAMSHDTRRDVRAVFWLLGIIAIVGAAAPVIWQWRPDPLHLAMAAAISAVQAVTARHWRSGVPKCFQRPGCIPRNRRSSDAPTILNLEQQP